MNLIYFIVGVFAASVLLGMFDAKGTLVLLGGVIAIFWAKWTQLQRNVRLLTDELEFLRRFGSTPIAPPNAQAAPSPVGKQASDSGQDLPASVPITAPPPILHQPRLRASSAPRQTGWNAPVTAQGVMEQLEGKSTPPAPTKSSDDLFETPEQAQAARAQFFASEPQPDPIAQVQASGMAAAKTPWPQPPKPDNQSWQQPSGGIASPWAGLISMENWPIKVGVLLLLIGLGSAFKYLVQNGYLQVSLTARMVLVAASCIAAVVFGYLSTEKRRSFGLSLQGGGLGGLLLTIYASMALFPLLLPKTALVLMLITVAVGVYLAVKQDSVWLASFAVIGGFAAPILCSTKSGNYVHLFAFYLILNLGVLAIAMSKGWRALNIIGALATFGIGITWGVNYYVPENFNNIEPFLIVFFLMYVVIAVLYTLKHGEGEAVLDGVLVFGVPLAALSAQAGLLHGNNKALALSALCVSGLYAGLHLWLRQNARALLLSQSFLILATCFFTLSIPLYFSASVTSALWALEGAAVIWLGLKQNRVLPQMLGQSLQLLAAFAFFKGFDAASAAPVVFNGRLLGALIIALGGLSCSYLFDRARNHTLGIVNFVWGSLWWLVVIALHIDQAVANSHQIAAVIFSGAVSIVLFAALQKGLSWPRIGWNAQIGMALLPMIVILLYSNQHHMFVEGRGFAMLAYLIASFAALRVMRTPWQDGLGFCHALVLLGVTLLVGLGADHQLGRDAMGDGLRFAIIVLPMIGFAGLLLSQMDGFAWPLQARFSGYRMALCNLVMVGLLALGFIGSVQPGFAKPMSYWPLVNPLEITLLATAWVFWLWHQRDGNVETDRSTWLGAMLLWFLTTASLRLTLHVLDSSLQTSTQGLMAAFASKTGQACLAIVWSILGCSAMLWGNAQKRRQVWLMGAGLMGVVLAKLVLVDRQNLGDVTGIVAMIGVGALLAGVGYFAPAPPAQDDEAP